MIALFIEIYIRYLTVSFNFSIKNLILIEPWVEQFTETNLLKINLRNDLTTDVLIYYSYLLARITAT